jgi:hypothetical protein
VRTILVLALGHLSSGEMTISRSCLSAITDPSTTVLFVSHESGAAYITSLGARCVALGSSDARTNRRAFAELLLEVRPDLLLCADVYTMEYASTWSGIDFSVLRSTGIPVASFDEYDWQSTDFRWDSMGGGASRVNPDLINSCDLLIRPCPLSTPRDVTRQNVVACRLFPSLHPEPIMARSDWLAALGLAPDRKVVFTVNSGWEYVNVSGSPQVAALIRWMPRILYQLLLSAGREISVVHVGPRAWDFPVDERVAYRHFPRMESHLYQETEKQADLFCGTNATSITMSNAVAAQTPAILLQSLKPIDFSVLGAVLPRMPRWYQQMAREVGASSPFRVFPWGWSSFLGTVLADNPYTGTFVQAPVFVPNKCASIFNTYLYDEGAIDRLRGRQVAYFTSLDRLAPLEGALAGVG